MSRAGRLSMIVAFAIALAFAAAPVAEAAPGKTRPNLKKT